MRQRVRLVKFREFVFILTFILLSCSHNPPKQTVENPSAWQAMAFVSHANWLALNIDPAPTNQIHEQIKTLSLDESKQQLKSRSEAHITIITPPEYEILKSTLSMKDLDALAQKSNIQSIKWDPVCIGRGIDKKNSQNLTYFLVVKSKGLFALRNKIWKAYLDKGGKSKKFDPNHFYPHITIAFTQRDLYEQDGVIKNTQSCYFDLSTPDGKKLTSW